jgi:hypothetical protein
MSQKFKLVGNYEFNYIINILIFLIKRELKSQAQHIGFLIKMRGERWRYG